MLVTLTFARAQHAGGKKSNLNLLSVYRISYWVHQSEHVTLINNLKMGPCSDGWSPINNTKKLRFTLRLTMNIQPWRILAVGQMPLFTATLYFSGLYSSYEVHRFHLHQNWHHQKLHNCYFWRNVSAAIWGFWGEVMLWPYEAPGMELAAYGWKIFQSTLIIGKKAVQPALIYI